MLGLDIISFLHKHVCVFIFFFFFFVFFLSYFFFNIKKKKKIGGEDAELLLLFLLFFSFDSFLDIVCIFFPDISVHCALIEYAYI
jgi:hypothetical protein